MVKLQKRSVIDLTEPPQRETGEMAAAATGLTKIYGEGNTRVLALDDIDIGFEAGKLTAIMGPSGSGKSTLLHCIAGLDEATAGEIRVGDTLLSELSDRSLTMLRREQMGFIFQAFNLVPTLTAEENILLPLLLGGKTPGPGIEYLQAFRTGLDLPDDTARFLLKRSRRDMASLYALLDKLDVAALRAKRRLTIPFVKNVIEEI